MEVKPGYRQTEIGFLPNDWQVRRVGDLGRVVRGSSPRPAGDPKYFNGSYIPWLTVAALTTISENQTTVETTETRLTELGASHSRTLEPGTLIIANSGATLGVAKLLGFRCCANDGIAALVQHRCGHLPFIAYVINSQTQRLRQVVATGNGQPNLNTTLVSDILVPFPAEAEQQAIAQALSNVDDLIQSLERLIVKKRGLKQAAMQQLLTGQTRLPGFSGEWQVRSLGSLGKCHRGVSYQPDRDLSRFETGGTLRLLRANNVQNARMVFEDMQYVSAVRVSEVQRLRPNDVLICMANGSRALVGKAAVFPDAADAAYTFGAFMGCFRPTPGLAESRFVFLLFQTEAYRKHIDLLLAGSSINNLRPSSIEALAVPIPSMISEQAAIAEVLSDMDAEIAALEARLAKTRDLKQGMMQELLTGRTRLV